MVSAKYEELYKEVRRLNDTKDRKPGMEGQSPSNSEQLDLYAWNKIARGADFSAATKPSFYNIFEKEKYKSWEKWVDVGITAQAAEEKYIKAVEELVAKYLP